MGESESLGAALEVRAVARVRESGGTEVLVRDEPAGAWRVWLGANQSYELAVEGFSEDGQALILRTDIGAGTTGLVWRRIQDGEQRVLARNADRWLLWIYRHEAGRRCYLWDRRTRKATLTRQRLDARLPGRCE